MKSDAVLSDNTSERKVDAMQNSNCLTADPIAIAGAKLHHVGVAAADIDSAAGELAMLFGAERLGSIIVDEAQKVRAQFVRMKDGQVIELLEPLGDDSPVAAAIARRQVLHHLCFEVDEIEAAVERGRRMGGVMPCPPQPAPAFDGRTIAFLYFRNLGLIEFLQSAEDAAST